jgi:hypothetical protein
VYYMLQKLNGRRSLPAAFFKNRPSEASSCGQWTWHCFLIRRFHARDSDGTKLHKGECSKSEDRSFFLSLVKIEVAHMCVYKFFCCLYIFLRRHDTVNCYLYVQIYMSHRQRCTYRFPIHPVISMYVLDSVI